MPSSPDSPSAPGSRENDEEIPEEYRGTPNPEAVLPELTEEELTVLGRIGQEWAQVLGDRQQWRDALPVDPNLGSYPAATDIRPQRFGRFVPVEGLRGALPAIEATERAEAPRSRLGRVTHTLRRFVLGPSLSASAIAAERMSKLVALPVLSADALSSVAYGPEAMLTILVLAGAAGLGYSLPIAGVIALMMLAVGMSYRQTIRAYPHGGGSYIVASDNLGRIPGLFAAAGLMIDYIMTVAVSIASGVQAITSAVPSLRSAKVMIGVVVIAVLLAGNLRGVRQAGVIFAAPSYAFIIAVFALVTVGLVDAAGRGFQPIPSQPVTATEGVTLLVVIRAFSSGSTAMTGIEAVSNAVPAFKPVEWRNARATLTWMIGLLIVLFAGTVLLVHLDGVTPTPHETVLSQLAHRGFGSGFMYVYTQAATAAILLLAANTAYNDFPRVLFLLARSSHAPRLFLRVGDRLAFSNGIIVLSLAAATIFVMFGGETESLIPLYAVGVFLAFTMSQTGMVVHWLRHRDETHWRRSLVLNAIGALLAALVLITAAVAKFTEGAWVALFAIASIIAVALRIRRHYDLATKATALHPRSIEVPTRLLTPASGEQVAPSEAPRGSDRPSGDGTATEAPGPETESEETPEEVRQLIIVPVAELHRASMRALAYAASLRQPLLALHLSPTEDEADRFREYWRTWGNHLPLEVVVSPHRAIAAPMVNYLWSLHHQRPELTLTVILPEIVVRHWWHRILHNHTAPRIRRALRPLPKVVVSTIPFHLDE